MMRKLMPTLVVLTLGVLIGPARAAVPDVKDLVKTTFLADTTSIEPGKPFQVGVLLKLAPKWHVYWSNPGEAGIPTTVEFHLPDGFTASPLQYPVPSRIEQAGDITMYGYSESVMLIATITPPQRFDAGDAKIAADLNYLVCEDSCIQGSAKLSLTLPAGKPSKGNEPELFAKWNRRLPVSTETGSAIASAKSDVAQAKNGDKITGQASIVVTWTADAPAKLDWFPPARDGIQFGKASFATREKTTTITVPFERFGTHPMSNPLESVVAYQTSDGPGGVVVPLSVEK